MLLHDLVSCSSDLTRTRSRTAKRERLRACLLRCEPDELALVVNYLSGILPQGKIGLGPAIFKRLQPAKAPSQAQLKLSTVDRCFSAIGDSTGPGSQKTRLSLLEDLFARATAAEQDFLQRLVLGALRQGALEAALIDGIAAANALPEAAVRRAVMLAGAAAPVAVAAQQHGQQGLDQFQLTPLQPVRPMLAQPAARVDDALAQFAVTQLDVKLDGARIQVHRAGDTVRVYSRQLNEVGWSLPEVHEAVQRMQPGDFILDGEVLALQGDGRPQPFQVTMRRFGRRSQLEEMRRRIPLSCYFFDCLYWRESLIDRPLRERREQLEQLVGAQAVVPGLLTGVPEQARDFLTQALEQGHEGLMAKNPASTYMAGNRGGDWLKIKQAHTLDLVVLGAEWGSGRRSGWLSNLHLGARDEDGNFVMLGKTFKGLTDKLLRWQTKALLERERARDEQTVYVHPDLVVEIALNDIQASPHYPAGLALRFARVKAYRADKTPAQADTLTTVQQLYEWQTGQAAPAIRRSA